MKCYFSVVENNHRGRDWNLALSSWANSPDNILLGALASWRLNLSGVGGFFPLQFPQPRIFEKDPGAFEACDEQAAAAFEQAQMKNINFEEPRRRVREDRQRAGSPAAAEPEFVTVVFPAACAPETLSGPGVQTRRRAF